MQDVILVPAIYDECEVLLEVDRILYGGPSGEHDPKQTYIAYLHGTAWDLANDSGLLHRMRCFRGTYLIHSEKLYCGRMIELRNEMYIKALVFGECYAINEASPDWFHLVTKIARYQHLLESA